MIKEGLRPLFSPLGIFFLKYLVKKFAVINISLIFVQDKRIKHTNMNLVKLAHQEILEINLDLDEVISQLEQGTYEEEFVEVESDNFIFYVSLDIKGKVEGSYAGWSDYQDPYFKEFIGEIKPSKIEAYHQESGEEFELKLTNQIIEQLKTTR